MWFFIGIAVVVGASLLVGWWRHGDGWAHERGPHGLFKLKRNSKTNKLNWVQAGIRTPTALEFEIKPETGIDRWAKDIGLSVEAQIGRAAFDQVAYLVSEDHRVVTLLRGDEALVESLKTLVEATDYPDFQFRQLICRGGFLRAEFTCIEQPGDHEPLLEWAAGVLKAAAAQLPGKSFVGESRRDRFRWRATALLAVSGGLAVNAFVETIRLYVQVLPFTVDLGALWIRAGVLSVLIIGVLAFATVAWLGRTSRAHLVLLEVLFFAVLGAPPTAFAALHDFNIEADHGEAEMLPAEVVGMESHRRRNRNTSHMVYTLRVTDWNGGSAIRSLDVSQFRYEISSIGSRLTIRQHPGRMGMRWVESFESAPSAGP